MWATGDGRYMSSYIYDAGGDRSLKLTGANLNFARCHSERSRRMNRSIDSGGGSSCKSLFATVDISTPLNVTISCGRISIIVCYCVRMSAGGDRYLRLTGANRDWFATSLPDMNVSCSTDQAK